MPFAARWTWCSLSPEKTEKIAGNSSGSRAAGCPSRAIGRRKITAPPPRRCSHGALRAVAVERDCWLLRLGVATMFVRQAARSPAMPHAAPASAVPIDPAALLPAPPTTNTLRGNPISPSPPAAAPAPAQAAPAGRRRSAANSAVARVAGAAPARARPRPCPGGGAGAVSQCATSAPTIAPLVQTCEPRTATAAPCCASAGSASSSTATRPTCRPRPPPTARRRPRQGPARSRPSNHSELIP